MKAGTVRGVTAPPPRLTVWALLGIATALSALWLAVWGLWRLLA